MWRLAVTLILLALTQGAAPVAAQWSLSAEIGVAGFSGTSRDSTGASVGPFRPTTFAIQVDRETGPARLGLMVLYAAPGLAGRQGNELIVQYGVISLWEIAPTLSVRLARFGAGGAAWVEAGPAVDLWQFDNEHRHRVGARAGVAFEWPLARSLSGSLRAGGVVSGSMVDASDVPADVDRVATRRLGIAVGVRYRM